MEEFIDFKSIMQIAMFMVGITQTLKQFFEIKNKKVKILVTLGVGIVGGVLLQFVPAWIFTTLLGMSIGVVFYDYVLKSIEKFFTGAER